jgi:hypothetical protein
MDKISVTNNEADMELPYVNFSSSLRIYGDLGDPAQIEQELGIRATHSHRKGDLRIENSNISWDTDAWIFVSPVPEDRPLDEHIGKLWELLRPHKKYLKELKKKVKIDIFNGYRSNSDSAGFEISPRSLDMFIELGIPFGISIIVV